MEDKHEKNLSSQDSKKTENKWVDYIIGIGFITLLIGLFGWLMNYHYSTEFYSVEEIYFTISSFLFGGFTVLFYFKMRQNQDLDKEEKRFVNIFIYFPAFILLSPILFMFFKLMLLLFCNWYYIVSLYLLIALLVICSKVKETSTRIIAIVLVALSIYLGHRARNIIDIKFSVIYDNERIM